MKTTITNELDSTFWFQARLRHYQTWRIVDLHASRWVKFFSLHITLRQTINLWIVHKSHIYGRPTTEGDFQITQNFDLIVHPKTNWEETVFRHQKSGWCVQKVPRNLNNGKKCLQNWFKLIQKCTFERKQF